MTVRVYKFVKAMTQFLGVGGGIYAMSLGADPTLTFAIIGTIIFGPEAMEMVIAGSDVDDADDV